MLGAKVQPWSAPFTPIELVTDRNRYLTQSVTGTRRSRRTTWASDGRGLQQIRHVERYEVFTNPTLHIPEMEATEFAQQHYLYHLGPAIVPQTEFEQAECSAHKP